MKFPRKPHVEVRPIKQYDCRRTPQSRSPEQRSICPIQFADRASYLEDADDSNFARVDERLDSRGAHLLAARAEELELDFRMKVRERSSKRRAVLIAAGLARDDHYG